LAKEVIGLKGTVEKMAGMLGKQKQDNGHLRAEIVRLNEIIL
jgi:hypothetical protein